MITHTGRRALVTGATGFVGSRLTRRLVEDGWNVHVVTRDSSSLDQLRPVLSQLKVWRVLRDEDLEGIVRKANPDVVFHLASRFIAEHKPEEVAELIDSNVRFGAHLLEAMDQNQKTRLVNAGTSWQYFETSEYRPVCLYAATKQAFESILDFYVDARDLRVVTLMLFDTYGPGDPRQKLFAALRKARTADPAMAFSQGEQLVDLVYIDDVVNAFLLAAERLLGNEGAAKERFAISSMAPLTLRQTAETYASVLRTSLNIAWGERPYRAREVMRPWKGGTPIPGWTPSVSLAEGILRTETPHD